MAISYANTVSFPTVHTTAGTTSSYSITIPTGAKIFFALFHLDMATNGAPGDPSFVRLNGVDMTFVARHVVSASGQGCYLYKYDNPPSGAAVTLSALHASNASFVTGCSVLASANLSITVGTSIASTATSYSASVASDTASSVLFFVASNNSSAAMVSGTSGQAVVAKVSPDGQGLTSMFAQAGSATSTTGTFTQTAANRTSVIPISLLELSSGGGNVVSFSASGYCGSGGAAVIRRSQAVASLGGSSASGGSASAVKSQLKASSGGVQAGTAAAVKWLRKGLAVGGVQLSGTASSVSVKKYAGSSGAQLNGAGLFKRSSLFKAAGGVLLGGFSLVTKKSSRVSSGGVLLGGSASVNGISVLKFISSGGVQLGGSAGVSRISVFKFLSSGGALLGSAAAVNRVLKSDSFGGSVIAGSALFDAFNSDIDDPIFVDAEHIALGGFVVSGAASASAILINSAVTRLDRPSQVFDAIVNTLASAIASGNQKNIKICDYEEWGPAQHADRQILIEFGDLESDVGQNDGRHGQWQEIIIYPVISVAVPRAAREANNLASAIARKILGQRWGLPSRLIEAPERITARSAFFVKQKDVFSYEAWEVRFWQLIKYGDDQWPGDEGNEAFFALAINPSNPDDPEEYQDVWPTR